MNNLKCALSNEELLIKCEQWINDLCRSGGKAWSLHVPPEVNNDPDFLFSELIDRFKNTLNNATKKEPNLPQNHALKFIPKNSVAENITLDDIPGVLQRYGIRINTKEHKYGI